MKTPQSDSDKEFPQSDIEAASADGPWTEAPTRVSRGPLVPCPSCKRHVFASTELTCPFCLAALPSDLAQRAAPTTTRRMSRGDVFYFNSRNIDASALSSVAGGVGLSQFGPAPAAEPGSNYGTGLGLGNWGELGGDHGGTIAAYGSPVPGPGTDFEPYHPGEDPGGGASMYGAPGEWPDPGAGEQQPGDGAEHGGYDAMANPEHGDGGNEYGGSEYSGGDYNGEYDGGNGGEYRGSEYAGGSEFAGGEYSGGDGGEGAGDGSEYA